MFQWFMVHRNNYSLDFMRDYMTDFLMEEFHEPELLKKKFDFIFFTGGQTVGKEVLRHTAEYLRVIIGNLSVQEYGAHYLRAKNVLSPGNEYNGDLIELVPISLIEYEDIY